MAPMKPITIPAQRRRPTFSPRSGIESSVTRIGLRNMMVVAVASGVERMPALKAPVVDMRSSERPSWRPGLRLINEPRAVRRPQAMAAKIVAKKNRPQVTSTSE